MNNKAKSLLIEELKKSTKKSQWMDDSSALFFDNKIKSVFDCINFGTFPSRLAAGVDTCADVVVMSDGKGIVVRFEDVFGIQAETPEEKDEIDSMANNSELPNGSEWKNGDKCSYEADNDSHTFIAMTESGKCCIRYDNANNFFEVKVGEISKPETTQQREERERFEAIHEMVDDFNEQEIDGVLRGRVARVCAALYDAGYRKAK